MSARRHERTLARRSTVQVLYTSEIQGDAPSAILETGRCASDEDLEGGPLSDYALVLIKGVEEHLAELDEQLEATSENWTVARMPVVDRSILRLATFEMLYVDDVPISVSINEAVELAKDFGGEDESSRFVNGILGRIAKNIEGEDFEVPEYVEEAAAGEAEEAAEEVSEEAVEEAVEEAAEEVAEEVSAEELPEASVEEAE